MIHEVFCVLLLATNGSRENEGVICMSITFSIKILFTLKTIPLLYGAGFLLPRGKEQGARIRHI